MTRTLLLMVALGLTLFLPITVEILGDLDWGPVVGGYLAVVYTSFVQALVMIAALLLLTFMSLQKVGGMTALVAMGLTFIAFEGYDLIATVAEEIPEAYKDVADVVDVVHGAGIGKKVVRLKPLGVLKG